jgi:hypothetical protein
VNTATPTAPTINLITAPRGYTVQIDGIPIGHVARTPLNPRVWDAVAPDGRTLLGQRSTRDLAVAALVRRWEHREQLLARLQGQTVPVPDLWPAEMRRLVAAARTAGWETYVHHGHDTQGYPYLTVDAAEAGSTGRQFYVAWHTRGSSGRAYELFTCMRSEPTTGRHVTILWALAELRTAPAGKDSAS